LFLAKIQSAKRKLQRTGQSSIGKDAPRQLTGPAKFVPSGMREHLGGKMGDANQEVQTRANRDDAAAD
jgi:hypothetical protein